MTIYERVEAMLVKGFGTEPGVISREATFDELDLDSLAQVEFGEVLSEQFGIEVDSEKFVTLDNLGELIDLLEAQGAHA
jgi:acyl carrier protein